MNQENIAEKLNNHYSQIGESMWNFNSKEGKEILNFTMYLKDFPDNTKNIVFDYLNIDHPVKPNFRDYSDDIYNADSLFDEAIDKYNYKELPEYNYKIKNLEENLKNHGIDIEKIPQILNLESNHLNILLNDLTKIISEMNKDLEYVTPILNVYTLNDEGNVVFQTLPKPLEITDRINLLTNSGDLYCKGEVKNISEDGIVLNTCNGIVNAPLDSRIEPLFLIDNNNHKKNIEFGVNETISLLTKKELPLHENYFGGRMKDFTDLLKGNKTSLLPFNKEGKEFYGKLHIITNREGKPIVNLDIKVNDLKSSLLQYSFLSESQKNQILKTGELGLVDIKKPTGNETEKMWVSVDKDLNKLVFKNEKQIRIDGIYGVPTTELEKNKLKSGEGTLMEILGENYFVIASAASKSSDGLRIFTEEKAREFKLIPEEKLEIKNDKTKSISFK